MNKIRLSICIPIYNFGAFIGATLDSIITQATNDVEIVIVDGASTDNTTEVIQRYQKTFPHLNYHRLEKRGGIDRDMAKTVELASGEYCWLFGGDDIMMPGTLTRMLEKISLGSDLFLCETILCDFNLHPIEKHNLFNIMAEKSFHLGNKAERSQYFESALNTAAFFSFCGSLIFKRSVWESVKINESFIGSCWAHVARFFEIIPHGLTVTYLPEPYLYKRGGNDSFGDRGIVRRLHLAIDGYSKLANAFFGKESMEAFHIRRVLRNEFSMLWFVYLKSECHKKKILGDILILDNLVNILYYDPLLTNRIYLFLYRFTPLSVYRVSSSIWRRIRALFVKMS